MGMGNLAKMAQQMQADMARAQQELDELRVEGTAGGEHHGAPSVGAGRCR